ncbi:MAG: High-affinity zinc uptake system ATP-binding protein ZnuC [Chloroflexi bacterium]|nr:High-affinity zinc uptake system ATP-binding protein ZnuC [Chloroflexota bacterium]
MTRNFLGLRKTFFTRRYAPHDHDAPIVALENVSVRYNGDLVLDQINFDLLAGQRVAVVGPNGAGKSTLFKVVAGLLDPSSGLVRIYGHEPKGHICISYIPQRNQVDWSFPVTVADVVMMGRVGKFSLLRWPMPQDWEEVHQALEVVGLEQLSKRQISELSGGQQQRMFIARALVQGAELMLMDEPLAGLDMPSQEGIFQTLDTLQEGDVTLLVAMHDLKLAAERFDHILLLKKKLIGFGSAKEVFTRELLAEAYGGHLHVIDGNMDTLAVSDTCCGGGDHGLD